MKLPGTLKVEIIKPTNDTWSRVGDRMRALRNCLGPALNETQRHLWPELQAIISAARSGTSAPQISSQRAAAFSGIRPVLKREWNQALVALQAYQQTQASKKSKKSKGVRVFHPDAFLPVLDCFSSETERILTSRWGGDHFKDLLSARSSVPSWNRNNAFYAEGRACSLSGPPDEARLRFPLFGQGKKSTEFVVSPAGRGHRALWNRMVDPKVQKQLADLRKERAWADKLRKAAKKAGEADWEAAASSRISDLTRLIEKLGAIKIGRIGLHYDERRRKWFALISWTQEREDIDLRGQVAVCNFGVNRLALFLAQDGQSLHQIGGQEILAARGKFAARRKSVQSRKPGPASLGRGKARRQAALTKIGDKESRYVTTYIRQAAAGVAKWCIAHGVATLYLEDLQDIRDSDDGTDHVNVRRFLHIWPFYEFGEAVKRACFKVGVEVVKKPAWYVSQKCPGCGYTHEDNVIWEERRADPIVHNGQTYYRFEKFARFQCGRCERRADSDHVACVNHLKHLGFNPSIDHVLTERRSKIVKAAEAQLQV